MQLITEDLLANLDVPAPSMSGVNTTILEDEAAAPALRIFLTLSQSSEMLLVAGYSAESVFWSRYYWFRRFANIRTARAGMDSGLEQQAFQILESPFPPCNPDWSQLEDLNARAVV
jgi:hypothetical protein